MILLPWEYLFYGFNSHNFYDLFHPTWIASAILLVVAIVMYAVRTRAMRAHPPFLDMHEWLLWTSIATFSLVLTGAVFAFSFILVLATIVAGLATLVWIRFVKFPPELAAWERQIARARYQSQRKFTRPEATIRTKPARRRRRR